LSAAVNGFFNVNTLQLSASINAGTEIYNLTIVGTINGNVLNGNYRITNSASVDQESGTLTLTKY